MCESTPSNKLKKFIKFHNETIVDKDLFLPTITFHKLRHTSATLLISNNMDVKTVSSRLGHSSTNTTLEIYAHTWKKKDEEAAELMENILKIAK